MNSLNRAQLIGNMTRDPELKHTSNGQSVLTCSVATNRSWKDANGTKHDDVEYHNVVCWGKLADIMAQYTRKGTKMYFSGRMQTRNWDDQNGVKHYRTEVVADEAIILTPKGMVEGTPAHFEAPDQPGQPDHEADDLPF
ncbi:single-stranded DNA-binding protein [Candidatus Peribacteria bacterium]|nr:single-stranded DNA-binding protein [Candidatus Peribacteria bacterium]